jgi:hypothetical protein
MICLLCHFILNVKLKAFASWYQFSVELTGKLPVLIKFLNRSSENTLPLYQTLSHYQLSCEIVGVNIYIYNRTSKTVNLQKSQRNSV